MKTDEKPQEEIRCAIYTRKSTSEGLSEDFTSLDAQRESGESYIQSQKTQGWVAMPDQYNDGGFTGANMDRPAMQQLLDDIKQGKVNCVVVYKVDRLSRSLLDFVKLLQFFEDHKVAFVSVTQHFNTNTSMGRLTLNILLSFAQFEREIISERTRDKIGAAKRKGKWVGGRPALGYDLDRGNHRIVVNHKEAELIRLIFELYIQEKSLLTVTKILNERGFRTKTHLRKGKPSGAVKFKHTNIQLTIKNWLYTGKIFYRGEVYPGLHEPIISEEIFRQANEILVNNRRERGVSKNTKSLGLLSGLFRCKDCGTAMCHTYAKKGNRKYLYYVCLDAMKRDRKDCPTRSVSAGKIEEAVLGFLRQLHREPTLSEKTWAGLTLLEKIEQVKSVLKEADYSAKSGILGLVLHNDSQRHEFPIDIKELKHCRTAKKEDVKNEPKLRQSLALAHQIEELLDSGKINNIKQLTGHLNMSHARINQLMAMTLLASPIQEDILLLENEHISRIPEYKLREITSEVDWQIQRNLWNKLLQTHSS